MISVAQLVGAEKEEKKTNFFLCFLARRKALVHIHSRAFFCSDFWDCSDQSCIKWFYFHPSMSSCVPQKRAPLQGIGRAYGLRKNQTEKESGCLGNGVDLDYQVSVSAGLVSSRVGSRLFFYVCGGNGDVGFFGRAAIGLVEEAGLVTRSPPFHRQQPYI